MEPNEEWKPGSFTKNYGWGDKSIGLSHLHVSINVGFMSKLEDVSREEFNQRVAVFNKPKLISTNYFLFNSNGIFSGSGASQNKLIVDELVFQALTRSHDGDFDKLALFALNFSYAGVWKGARKSQRRPALWAFHYIKDRVSSSFEWNTSNINTDDIENYLINSPRYSAKAKDTTRKIASNLYYLYQVGGLSAFEEKRVERWWADALFLALDRIIEDKKIDGEEILPEDYANALSNSGFHSISGKQSLEKQVAEKHLIRLYVMCGGRERFSSEKIKGKVTSSLSGEDWSIPNTKDPYGAIHPTNPSILKRIPPECEPLAKAAGFDVINSFELEEFDAGDYINKKMEEARREIDRSQITPIMSPDEFIKLVRG